VIDSNPCHIRAAGITGRTRKIQPATPDELAQLIGELPDPDRVLVLSAGLHHGSMYKVFKRARKQIVRPDLRFHDLCHTGATMAAQAGATMRELMDRLGHSTPQAALIYQHAAVDHQAAVAACLSEMVSSTNKQPT
jgi:integrase